MKLLGLDVAKYWSGEQTADKQEDIIQAPEAKRFKQDTTVEQVA